LWYKTTSSVVYYLQRMSRGKSSKRFSLPADAGMTLLELIVVVAVIGILAAIAIQQFQLHRARAIDASMRSDLKNAAMAMESYYGEFLEYPNSTSAILLVGYRNTGGVTLTINVTSPSTFTLTAARAHGSQASFIYDSTTGLIN
jgi:prepilin-type N-terminal cleavage/methylation domain-containing protein